MLEFSSTLYLTPFPWHHGAAGPCSVTVGTVWYRPPAAAVGSSTPPARPSSGGACSRPGAFCRPRRFGRVSAGHAGAIRLLPHGHLNIQQFSLLPLWSSSLYFAGAYSNRPSLEISWAPPQHYKYFVSRNNHTPTALSAQLSAGSAHAPRPPVSPSLPPCCGCNSPPGVDLSIRTRHPLDDNMPLDDHHCRDLDALRSSHCLSPVPAPAR